MNEQDGKKKGTRVKANIPVFKAPRGNVKGIGPTGQYTGGLSPTVVAPVPGLPSRRVAPTIFRGYGTDGSRGKGKR